VILFSFTCSFRWGFPRHGLRGRSLCADLCVHSLQECVRGEGNRTGKGRNETRPVCSTDLSCSHRKLQSCMALQSFPELRQGGQTSALRLTTHWMWAALEKCDLGPGSSFQQRTSPAALRSQHTLLPEDLRQLGSTTRGQKISSWALSLVTH
jgi:hypothetical protein